MNTPKLLIAICGPLGSGKSTAAKYLETRRGFTRTRFAAKLKAMLHALGLDERHTDGDLKEVPSVLLGGKTPRHAMQTLGTEWGRDLIASDLWTRAWHASLDPEDLIVVDDLRFANEANLVRELGGYIVRVDRPALDCGETSRAHASENGDLGPADYILDNSGALSCLERGMADLYETIHRKHFDEEPPEEGVVGENDDQWLRLQLEINVAEEDEWGVGVVPGSGDELPPPSTLGPALTFVARKFVEHFGVEDNEND